ncbi:MAG: molecular chaperone DnaJ [Prochlorococcus sp.]
MKPSEDKGSRRITVELPNHLITRLDELKREWGLRARGDLLVRLLEELFTPQESLQVEETETSSTAHTKESARELNDRQNLLIETPNSEYNETKALVLVGKGVINETETILHSDQQHNQQETGSGSIRSGGIDLPGFVRRRTDHLRESLEKHSHVSNSRDMPVIPTDMNNDVLLSLKTANQHWISLYGNPPGETVVEAAMVWLARDIWLHVDGTEGRPFTWSAANRSMKEVCSSWETLPATFERVMVVAGVLEDPFASDSLPERMPTLIRRFVNRFKRSRQVTSFQTLESTMTLHGALKLLKLPTHAGAPLKLAAIRDAYKGQAMAIHPDAGGSTEAMRRLNEAYQMLKELYRQKT